MAVPTIHFGRGFIPYTPVVFNLCVAAPRGVAGYYQGATFAIETKNKISSKTKYRKENENRTIKIYPPI